MDASALIEAAQKRRTTYLQGALRQDAYRILNGAGDGAPAGLCLDRYGDYLVLSVREKTRGHEPWIDAAQDVLNPAAIVLKEVRRPASSTTSQLVRGALPETPIAVHEDDATFLCELNDGAATGLFLDQHDLRRRIRAFASGRSVLNLFAYTCSFSVHAALAGAERVTSVDVSKKALRRGRENMSASGLDPDAHRWFSDDVIEHLDRARRRSDRYGLVILDPPTFGRSRGKWLSIERDLEALVDKTISVVAPGGVLVLALHGAEIGPDRGLEAVRQAAGGRAVELLERHGLPEWDHPAITAPGPADRGDYLQTLVLTIG